MRHNEPCKRFLFGSMFGPMLIVHATHPSITLEHALDEWDEQFGERVGDEMSERELTQAYADGEVRINDGGTTVHVDPYEWFEEYDSGAELRKRWGVDKLRKVRVVRI